jgi:hypothetical protein
VAFLTFLAILRDFGGILVFMGFLSYFAFIFHIWKFLPSFALAGNCSQVVLASLAHR